MAEKKLTLILGGARSGKSDYAQNLAASLSAADGSPVVYAATAQAGDEEMHRRIENHRASRPAAWQTVEAPCRVGAAVLESAPLAGVVLLDCLTLLASNRLASLPEPMDEEEGQRLLDEELADMLAAYEKMNAAWIIVSNEVGLGLVPPYPLGRIYRDVLGRVNQRLAARADEVVFMAAGLPMVLKSSEKSHGG